MGDQASPECDEFCAHVNGGSSYCKWWQKEPVCKGGDQPCGVGQCDIGDSPSAPPTTGERHESAEPECDYYCTDANEGVHNGSYCKWWLEEPLCKHGDQPCGRSVCGNYPKEVDP